MKRLITLVLSSALALNTWAQTDTTTIKADLKNVKDVEVITDEWGDTTHVKIGDKTYKVIEGDNGKYFKEVKDVKNVKAASDVTEVKVGKKNVVTVA